LYIWARLRLPAQFVQVAGHQFRFLRPGVVLDDPVRLLQSELPHLQIDVGLHLVIKTLEARREDGLVGLLGELRSRSGQGDRRRGRRGLRHPGQDVEQHRRHRKERREHEAEDDVAVSDFEAVEELHLGIHHGHDADRGAADHREEGTDDQHCLEDRAKSHGR
jgi:hypothetical protein